MAAFDLRIKIPYKIYTLLNKIKLNLIKRSKQYTEERFDYTVMYFNVCLKNNVAKTLCIICTSLISLIIFLILLPPKPAVIDASCNGAIELPILMYHGLIKNPKQQNKFMINPTTFENDLIYIKNNGYTTIFVQDLIDYVYNDKQLPEKPIMITFDDGYYNNYLYAFPLIKKYECKIVLSPIGKCVDDYSKITDEHPSYSYITWEHLKEMVNSGFVEIQNHTYNMHSSKKGRLGCTKMKKESLKEYENSLTQDITKMQQRFNDEIGIIPPAFVFPFGAISKDAPCIIKNLGFKCTFCCEGRINRITKDPECLYNLCRFIRANSPNTKQYFSKTLKIK